MQRNADFQRAINYLEEHLEDEIDYGKVAEAAYCSSYHFQRVFGILSGFTLGEYIRRRRLTRAAADLLTGEKVISAAMKYGYNSADSFSRAFYRFHGVLPSQVKRGAPVKVFPPLCLEEGEDSAQPECTIEQREAKILVGFGKRFCGVPYGQERLEQEDKFYKATRGKQWLLIGASKDYTTEYALVTDVGDDGYDFYIAYELDEWTRNALFAPAITGMDLHDLGLKIIELPKRTCAIFKTKKSRAPIAEYTDIRRRIAAEWLPKCDYRLIDAPEVTTLHWRTDMCSKECERFIEIALPVDRK